MLPSRKACGNVETFACTVIPLGMPGFRSAFGGVRVNHWPLEYSGVAWKVVVRAELFNIPTCTGGGAGSPSTPVKIMPCGETIGGVGVPGGNTISSTVITCWDGCAPGAVNMT